MSLVGFHKTHDSILNFYAERWPSGPARNAGNGIHARSAGKRMRLQPQAEGSVRRGGRVAEGGGLLNRYTVFKPYREFESHPLRHFYFTNYSLCGSMGVWKPCGCGVCRASCALRGGWRFTRSCVFLLSIRLFYAFAVHFGGQVHGGNLPVFRSGVFFGFGEQPSTS